jgi:hypothetical protein
MLLADVAAFKQLKTNWYKLVGDLRFVIIWNKNVKFLENNFIIIIGFRICGLISIDKDAIIF